MRLTEMVPRNARLWEVLRIIRDNELGTIRKDGAEWVIDLNIRHGKPRFRFSQSRHDAGLVLVSAVRQALKEAAWHRE